MFAEVFRVNEGGRRAPSVTMKTRRYKTMSGLVRAVNKELGEGVYILDLYHQCRPRFLGPVNTRRLLLRSGAEPVIK